MNNCYYCQYMRDLSYTMLCINKNKKVKQMSEIITRVDKFIKRWPYRKNGSPL